MYIKYVVTPDIVAHLAYGFEEGLAFDVADGAADFHQDNIRA